MNTVVNNCLLSSLLFKITFLTRKGNSYLLLSIVTIQVQRCVRECMPSTQNCGLCEPKYCGTASCTLAASWNLLPRRYFFGAPKRGKSFGAVTARTLTDSSFFYRNLGCIASKIVLKGSTSRPVISLFSAL
jgi:hypothetical protein